MNDKDIKILRLQELIRQLRRKVCRQKRMLSGKIMPDKTRYIKLTNEINQELLNQKNLKLAYDYQFETIRRLLEENLQLKMQLHLYAILIKEEF